MSNKWCPKDAFTWNAIQEELPIPVKENPTSDETSGAINEETKLKYSLNGDGVNHELTEGEIQAVDEHGNVWLDTYDDYEYWAQSQGPEEYLRITSKKNKAFRAGLIANGLPSDSDLAEFLDSQIKEPKHLLNGLFRKGQVMILSGASKTYKSWTAMEIALAISQGGKFVNWPANIGKVYYVDTELEGFDFQKRMKMIAKGLGYAPILAI